MPLSKKIKRHRDPMYRIGYMEGLRRLANIAVFFYHYFSRYSDWEASIYTHDGVLADFPRFMYGIYRVLLFIGTSGFVIVLTLIYVTCESPEMSGVASLLVRVEIGIVLAVSSNQILRYWDDLMIRLILKSGSAI